MLADEAGLGSGAIQRASSGAGCAVSAKCRHFKRAPGENNSLARVVQKALAPEFIHMLRHGFPGSSRITTVRLMKRSTLASDAIAMG